MLCIGTPYSRVLNCEEMIQERDAKIYETYGSHVRVWRS